MKQIAIEKEETSYEVRLPTQEEGLDQDEEYCILVEDGSRRQVRFHDYHEIYSRPGLYETIFYELLECKSPGVVSSLLVDEVRTAGESPAAMSVLDLGAGNGMVGEALAVRGFDSIVGVDIIEEAAEAMQRDRPQIYEDYFVEDLTELPPTARQALQEHHFDCLTCVAALGYADIPPEAFRVAFNLVSDDGWVAFNIKDAFVDDEDPTGFARLIDRSVADGAIEICKRHAYRHRLAIDGRPLDYVAMVGRKREDIPASYVEC